MTVTIVDILQALRRSLTNKAGTARAVENAA